MIWSELPTSGFMTGGAATREDVAAGRAVFSMDGKSEGPLPVAIPQYAIWTDENGGEHPVILVQAEQAPDGTQIVGLLNADESHTAATMAELSLRGTEVTN